MSIAECNRLLGPNWTDYEYDRGRGLCRVYEALRPAKDPEDAMMNADLYFRWKKLTKWWGQVEEIAQHVAASKQRARLRGP